MLITKTFCKPGSLIYIVPTGLLVTLRYDAHGQLNGIFKGFSAHGEPTGEELSQEFLQVVRTNGLVPLSLKQMGTTSVVWGVFYSDVFTVKAGEVPTCEYDRIIKDIISGNIK